MFADAMERIQAATNLQTQTALAKCLGIQQSGISDAKRRESVPGAWLVALYEKFGVNPTWIKSGQGPVYLAGDPDRIRPVGKPTFMPPPEPTVTELKEALEARLGEGLRIVIVGVEDQVVTTPAIVAGTEGIAEQEKEETPCNAS